MIAKSATTLFFYRLAVGNYLALLLYMPVYLLYLVPDSMSSTGFLFTLYYAPLWLPAYGILRDRPYTFAWANFILIILFLQSLSSLWVYPNAWLWTAFEVIMVTGMFIGCTYYARHRGRELGMKVPKLKDDLQQERDAHQAPRKP